MRAFLLSICLTLSGCAFYTSAPEASPAPLTDCQREEALGFVCLSDAPAPTITPGEWEQGALSAAESLGCKRTVWQIDGETFKEAAAVYAHDYLPGDCVILAPHHGGPNYYLGYAGQCDGCECGPLIAECRTISIT